MKASGLNSRPEPASVRHYIVSSELPMGLSWFLNILLELSIKTHRSDAEEFWRQEGQAFFLQPAHDEVKRWLPSLLHRTSFSFPEPIHFQWTHVWPREDILESPIVFYSRCGLDAVYSQYRRLGGGPRFLTYLHSPYREEGSHFPVVTNLSPPDTWALYSLLWKRMAHKGSLWLRFEDMKQDPVGDTSRFLSRFGLQRSPEEIRTALEHSSFDKAREAEQRYSQSKGLAETVQINRGGKVREWEKTYGPDELSSFSGLPALALKEFGYQEESSRIPALDSGWFTQPTDWGMWIELLKSKPPLGRIENHVTQPLQLLNYARLLSVVHWEQEIERATGVKSSADFRSKLVKEMLELSRLLAPTVLNVSTFARSLHRSGATGLAKRLLGEFLSPAKASFFEALQLGSLYHDLGLRIESRNWFRKAGGLLEGNSNARLYAWNQVEAGDFLGAFTFLRAAKTAGWSLLVARALLKEFRRKTN